MIRLLWLPWEDYHLIETRGIACTLHCVPAWGAEHCIVSLPGAQSTAYLIHMAMSAYIFFQDNTVACSPPTGDALIGLCFFCTDMTYDREGSPWKHLQSLQLRC